MAFNFTLELTKVVPIGLAASKVGGALMSLARDLQGSGSDIVVEEDLLILFGAGLIERQMESSFKTIISRAASSTTLLDSLFLSGGPGPTVNRAFQKDSAPYFAMVIQCSLLASVHSVGSLASALKDIFELHIEQDTKNKSSMVAPTVERIKGFLQTCQDQTAAFDWSGLLFAVAKSLEMSDDDDGVSQPLMPHILHGALVMFPKVQRFPDVHMVQISSPGWNCGFCLLVVWSHHVLGLTTVVRYRDLDGMATEFRFEGPNTKQDSIIIDIAGPDGHKVTAEPEPSITLLSASKDEKENLTISPDQDYDEIESLFMIPAHGYGWRVLKTTEYEGNARKAVLDELVFIACGLALHMSRHIYLSPATKHNWPDNAYNPSELYNPIDVPEEDNMVRLSFSETRFLMAAAFLFHRTDEPFTFTLKRLEKYAMHIQELGLAPQAIQNALARNGEDAGRVWRNLYSVAKGLAVLLLAFTHIRDLEACVGLPLIHDPDLRAHPLLKQLQSWNGRDLIPISTSTWFRVFSILMDRCSEGSATQYDLTEPLCSLICRRGWSIYVSTFGSLDPSSIDQGFVVAKRGVPCRNGEWKHNVIDGFRSTQIEGWPVEVQNQGAIKSEFSCSEPLRFGRTMYGVRDDSFVVNLQITFSPNLGRDKRGKYVSGFRLLSDTSWAIHKTEKCEHDSKSLLELVLSPDCVMVNRVEYDCGSNMMISIFDSARIYIILSAENKAARWLALHDIHYIRMSEPRASNIGTVLRGANCCFQCAVDQTSQRARSWFLVL